MAGILNTTARQYNLRARNKKTGMHTSLRVAPGYNDVDDKVWDEFRGNPFVRDLINRKIIVIGKNIDDHVKKEGGDTVVKVTQKPGPKKKGKEFQKEENLPPAPPVA